MFLVYILLIFISDLKKNQKRAYNTQVHLVQSWIQLLENMKYDTLCTGQKPQPCRRSCLKCEWNKTVTKADILHLVIMYTYKISNKLLTPVQQWKTFSYEGDGTSFIDRLKTSQKCKISAFVYDKTLMICLFHCLRCTFTLWTVGDSQNNSWSTTMVQPD